MPVPPSSAEAEDRRRGLAALAHRDFTLLWVGQMVSHTGSWIQQVAQGWLILELTDSVFLLGLNGVFMAVPFIASSLWGGALADRGNRRKLLIVTQTLSAVLALVQGLLVTTGVVQVWQIYLLSALSWVVAAFDTPARQALIPQVVPRHHLGSAIALMSVVRRGTGLVGPALGGIIVALLGVAGAYYTNAVSFLVVVGALVAMAPTPAPIGGQASMAEALVAGLRFVAKDRLLGRLLLLEAAISLFASYPGLLAYFARDVLHAGATGLGMLFSAPGVGALLGTAWLVGRRGRIDPGRLTLGTSLLVPVALAAFALSTSFPLSLALLVAVGALDQVSGTMRQTILQLRSPGPLRGRVMGMHAITGRGLHPLGSAQAGAVGGVIGVPAAFVLSALACIATAVWSGLTTPELRQFAGGERTALADHRSGAESL